MEEIISNVCNLFFNFKDPLSGFKVYRTSVLKNKKFQNIGNYFLVDFLFALIKNRKVSNFEITTKKRPDIQRVGGLIGLSFKELKILLKIITIKFVQK